MTAMKERENHQYNQHMWKIISSLKIPTHPPLITFPMLHPLCKYTSPFASSRSFIQKKQNVFFKQKLRKNNKKFNYQVLR